MFYNSVSSTAGFTVINIMLVVSPSPPQDEDDQVLSVGQIAGIVIGVSVGTLLLVIISVLVGYCLGYVYVCVCVCVCTCMCVYMCLCVCKCIHCKYSYTCQTL